VPSRSARADLRACPSAPRAPDSRGASGSGSGSRSPARSIRATNHFTGHCAHTSSEEAGPDVLSQLRRYLLLAQWAEWVGQPRAGDRQMRARRCGCELIGAAAGIRTAELLLRSGTSRSPGRESPTAPQRPARRVLLQPLLNRSRCRYKHDLAFATPSSSPACQLSNSSSPDVTPTRYDHKQSSRQRIHLPDSPPPQPRSFASRLVPLRPAAASDRRRWKHPPADPHRNMSLSLPTHQRVWDTSPLPLPFVPRLRKTPSTLAASSTRHFRSRHRAPVRQLASARLPTATARALNPAHRSRATTRTPRGA